MDKAKANEIIGVDENASDKEKTDAYYKHLVNFASGFAPTDKETGEQLTKETLEEAFEKSIEHEKIPEKLLIGNRMGDFFRYHGLKIFIGIIVLILISTTLFYKLNTPKYDLRVLFIGATYYGADISSLEDVIRTKMPEFNNIKVSQIDVGFSAESSAVIYQKTQIQITEGEYDIFICDSESFAEYAATGAFINLDPILKQIGSPPIDEHLKLFDKNLDPKLGYAPVGVNILYGIDVSNNDFMKIVMAKSAADPASANVLIDNNTSKIVAMSYMPNNSANCLKFLKLILG